MCEFCSLHGRHDVLYHRQADYKVAYSSTNILGQYERHGFLYKVTSPVEEEHDLSSLRSSKELLISSVLSYFLNNSTFGRMAIVCLYIHTQMIQKHLFDPSIGNGFKPQTR